MKPASRRGLSRRTVLKLGLAGAAAALIPQPATIVDAYPRIASTLPLPFPHTHSEAESLLDRPLGRYDLVLAPAYIAATLIRRGTLQTVGGSPGRAHDPDGAYTIPYRYHVAALRAGAADQLSWAVLQQAGARVPAGLPSRVAIGAALLSRGYSPNDTHAGHLAQAGDDLAHLLGVGPKLVSGPSVELVDAGSASGMDLPQEGVPLIEYDWVIPAGGNAALAGLFLRSLGRPAQPPSLSGTRFIPLMPLPHTVRRQHLAIWSSLGRTTAAV